MHVVLLVEVVVERSIIITSRLMKDSGEGSFITCPDLCKILVLSFQGDSISLQFFLSILLLTPLVHSLPTDSECFLPRDLALAL